MNREKTFEGGRQFVATVSQALTPTALAESVGEALREVDRSSMLSPPPRWR